MTPTVAYWAAQTLTDRPTGGIADVQRPTAKPGKCWLTTDGTTLGAQEDDCPTVPL